MPNSDANVTRSNILRLAFAQIGNTNASANDNADAVTVLNAKIKEIDEQGRWLWAVTNTESSLTLSNGTSAYDTGASPTGIATDILEFEKVQLLVGTSYIPIDIIPKTESLFTWEREASGQPYLVHLEVKPLMTSQKAHFFPTPDSAYAVKYNYRRRLYDFDLPSDNPDFPPGWQLKLVRILAGELAAFYLPLSEASGHIALGAQAEEKGRQANKDKADPTPQLAEYF